MLELIPWYLLVTLVGWLAFPLAYRLLPGLSDRGYAFARTLGLLLWGYIFWLLASVGMLGNTAGSLLFSLILVALLSAWMLRRGGLAELRAWLSKERGLVITVELLSLAAFVAWAVVRAANPEAVGTEKPMELAFINAILHSPTFPPHDPWLSGYAISYYYFGYIITAMLAKLSGTSGGVAFNLGIATTFALSATGAFGLAYDLLKARSGQAQPGNPAAGLKKPALLAMLAPLLALIVSNLEGFLHMLHTRGLFWVQNASGEWVAPFWKWLDINDLNVPPALPLSWVPTRFWWWWRASRVVQDYDFSGGPREIIDEFPFFSYLLSDLHPHVLAMPFAFLTVTLALNLFLGGAEGRLNLRRRINIRTLTWVGLLSFTIGLAVLLLGFSPFAARLVLAGILGLAIGGLILLYLIPELSTNGLGVLRRNDLGSLEIGRPLEINLLAFILAGVVLGGMAFLNTWDFPVYVALFAGAFALKKIKDEGERAATPVGEVPGEAADEADSRPEAEMEPPTLESPRLAQDRRFSWGEVAKDFFEMAFLLGVCGGLFYLPFYLGFSSQAGGILPNLIYPTRGAHLWVMFGVLLVPMLAFELYQLWAAPGAGKNLTWGFSLSATLGLGLWLLSLLLGLIIILLPVLGDVYLGSLAASDSQALFVEAFKRRLASPGGWITMFVLIALTLALLLPQKPARQGQARQDAATARVPASQLSADMFALLLVLLGALLVFGPEFFYLRDQFGWRINTIFKFYFQAWLVWSIAAAYCTAVLVSSARRPWNFVLGLVIGALFLMGLVYPAFSLGSKTNDFQPAAGWTLDSTAYMQQQSPDEMKAIEWLQSAPAGTVAEAVAQTGGSYTGYARVATLSGQPAVLGWTGHESQWRGGAEEMGSRQADLERLYCTKNWEEAQAVLDQYQIRYVFVGPLERSTYLPGGPNCTAGLMQAKFENYLTPVFVQGDVKIYAVP